MQLTVYQIWDRLCASSAESRISSSREQSEASHPARYTSVAAKCTRLLQAWEPMTALEFAAVCRKSHWLVLVFSPAFTLSKSTFILSLLLSFLSNALSLQLALLSIVISRVKVNLPSSLPFRDLEQNASSNSGGNTGTRYEVHCNMEGHWDWDTFLTPTPVVFCLGTWNIKH